MKKLVFFLALASYAFGSEGFLIGFETSYVTFDKEARTRINNLDVVLKSDGDPNAGLKLGYAFNDMHRIYGIYAYTADSFESSWLGLNTSIKTKENIFTLAYDFTPELVKDLRLATGVFGSYKALNVKVNNDGFSVSKDYHSYSYGLKLGFLYDLSDHNEIELGYKFEQNDYNGGKIIDDKTRSSIFYLGYAYRF